jgi:hypothetical protein
MADDNTPQEAAPATDANEIPADLGDAGKKALDRMKAERDEARKQAKALADAEKRLKQYEDRDKTEAQKLAERAEQAERELNALRVESLRSQVALTKGLPADLLEFLTATDEEGVSAQADRLLARLATTAPSSRPAGDIDQGARTTPLALNGDPLLDGLKQSLGIR